VAPKFPPNPSFAPHINQYSPRILQAKKQTQQIVQVVKWEAPENQLKAHSQTATTKSPKQVHNRYLLQQSLPPPTITKQETSKATTELLFQTLISKLVCGVKTVIIWAGY
jgi:hypothetical protein